MGSSKQIEPAQQFLPTRSSSRNRFFQLFTRHAEGGVVGTGINTSWGAANALALIASSGFLMDDRDLDLTLHSEVILLADHSNVSIRTVACTQAATDAVILNDDLLRAFTEDRIDGAAD